MADKSGLTGFQASGKHTSQSQALFSKVKSEMTTPGWQWIWKIVVFITFIGIFGAIYHFHMTANPKEWSTKKDKNGNVIVNGLYTSTVITGTVGYGDYYPYSMTAISIVLLNTVLGWLLFTTFLG